MRRWKLSALFLLATAAVSAAWLVLRLLAFVHIFYAHAGVAVTQPQTIAAHHHHDAVNGTDARPQLIPRIIHQVFHNWHDPDSDALPSDWERTRATCVRFNPDWEHKLWTANASRDFLEAEYPWFLRTYDGYRHPVQRVDAVRYFLLLHYGGIYLDLDNGCKRDLEPLLYYATWVTDPGRGALSNNVLATRPHHPYWTMLTQSLMAYDYNYLFPYVTVSYASGQWFVTDVWERYHALLPRPAPAPAPAPAHHHHRLHRLMMDDRVGVGDEISFFTQESGGTWNSWDNRIFLLLGDHLVAVLLLLCAAGCALVWTASRAMRARGVAAYSMLRNEA